MMGEKAYHELWEVDMGSAGQVAVLQSDCGPKVVASRGICCAE